MRRNVPAQFPPRRLPRRSTQSSSHRFRTPPSLEELAGRLFLGRSKLCTAYRAETGLTVGQRLVELRMEQAKAMLERSEAPIEEIARSVGYAHQSSFTAAFKRTAGCTPTQWRAGRGTGQCRTS